LLSPPHSAFPSVKKQRTSQSIIQQQLQFPVRTVSAAIELLETAWKKSQELLSSRELYYDSKTYSWCLSDGTPLCGLLHYHEQLYYVPEEESRWHKPENRSASSCWTGKAVEEELEHIFKDRMGLKLSQLNQLKTLPHLLGLKWKPQRYTTKIMTALRREGVFPCFFQLPLVHKARHTITYADAVGVELITGKLVLIELKTGYDYGYKMSRGSMRFPSQYSIVVPDSDRNRHLLQLYHTAQSAESWLHLKFEKKLLIVAHTRKEAAVYDLAQHRSAGYRWVRQLEICPFQTESELLPKEEEKEEGVEKNTDR
jgi:hypothetical protein